MKKNNNEKRKFMNMFIVRVSDNYYNNNQVEVKKQITKRNIVRNFMEEIANREPIVPNTPASSVHRINLMKDNKPITKSKQGQFKPMSSMHEMEESGKDLLSKSDSTRLNSIRRKTFTVQSNTITPHSGKDLDFGVQLASNISPFSKNYSSVKDTSQAQSSLWGINRQRIVKDAEDKVKIALSRGKEQTPRCDVCLDKDANTVYEPCFHGGMCVDCALRCYQKNAKQCPLCREVVST